MSSCVCLCLCLFTVNYFSRSFFQLSVFMYSGILFTGEVINERDRCQACVGRKVIQQTKILEVHVDKGMRDDQRITFRGEGDQMPGVEPGDVIIVLQVIFVFFLSFVYSFLFSIPYCILEIMFTFWYMFAK